MRKLAAGLIVLASYALFGALLGAPFAAQAASFDCAKARAKIEKAICADKDLSALDEHMAAAYKKQLGAWQGSIAEYVRNDQREFNTMLRQAGGSETQDDIDCAKAYVKCIRERMAERIAVLESRAYGMSGVYERANGKLLVRALQGDEFEVLLFSRKPQVVRSTPKVEGANRLNVVPGASGYVTGDVLASKLAGEGNPDCDVRLTMNATVAEVTQTGKCGGANFAGKYNRRMKDRVDNYEHGID